MRMLWFNKHARYRENLSAYVDGQMSDRDEAALESHLASCDDCRTELEALRAVSLAVRELPEAAAPRSFALTAEQVTRAPEPRQMRAEPMQRWHLAGAALAAAVAFVLVIDASDVRLRTGGGDSSDERAALELISQDRTLSQYAEDAAATATIVITASRNDGADEPAATAASRNSDGDSEGGSGSGGSGGAGGSGGGSGSGGAGGPGAAVPTPLAEPTADPEFPASAGGPGVPPADTTAADLEIDTDPVLPVPADKDAKSTPLTIDQAFMELEDLAAEAQGDTSESANAGFPTVRVIEAALAAILAGVAVGGFVVVLRRRR